MHIYQYSEQLLWQNGDPYCQRSTIAVKDEKKILKKAISNISLIRVTERFAAGTLSLTYNHLRQKEEVWFASGGSRHSSLSIHRRRTSESHHIAYNGGERFTEKG